MIEIFLVLAGILITCIGFWSLHVYDKTHPFLSRISAALITVFGLGNIWGAALYVIPVLDSKHLRFVKSEDNWVVLEARYSMIRDCTLIGSTVFVNHAGIVVQAPTLPIAAEADELKRHRMLLLLDQHFVIGDFTLEFTYRCPFNIIKVEKFDKVQLKAEDFDEHVK